LGVNGIELRRVYSLNLVPVFLKIFSGSQNGGF